MRVSGAASGIFCTTWSAATLATAPVTFQRRFALPPEAAAIAIPEFARQADVQILIAEEVTRRRVTNGVGGTMSVDRALRRFLQGTGIIVSYNDGHTVLLTAGGRAARAPEKPIRSVPARHSRVLASDPLAEIVVTAERRSEDRQQVPISVVAIDRDMAARAGITQTTDLSMLVPGLLYTQGVGLGIPYIRGVGSTANGPGAENEVALYVDDVYQGSKAAAINAFPDLSQIEVMRGPQGTLFGRNATGGLIQISTLEPQASPGGFLRLGYGAYDTIDASLHATGPLGSRAAVSISAFEKDQLDGWGRNLPTADPVNRGRERGVRFKLNITPDDMTEVRLGADWSSLRSSIGSAYRPVDGALPAYGTPFKAGRYDTVDTIDPVASSQTAGASIRIERDIGSTMLSSISAYRRALWRIALDEDWQPVNRLDLSGGVHENAYSQELRLAGPTGERLQVQGGLYIYLAGGRQPFVFTGDSLAPLSATETVGSQSTRSYAFYAQALQQLDDAMHLTLGSRYTIERRHLTGYQTQSDAAGALFLSKPTDRRNSNNAPTWRIALDRRVAPDMLAYASYNRGFKSGGFNPGNLTGPSLRPERIDAVEAGIKSEWLAHRLRINLGAFHYAWRNIQLQTNRNGVPLLTNAASARLEGIDADADAQVTRRLRLSAAAELLHSRFTDYPDAPGATPLASGGNAISMIDARGNRLPFSPHVTASLSASYDIAIYDGHLSTSTTVRYTAHHFTEANNLLVQPGYAVLNAQLHWQSRDRRYGLTFWGNNLTDRFYAAALTVQPAASVISAAAPRTFGAMIELRF